MLEDIDRYSNSDFAYHKAIHAQRLDLALEAANVLRLTKGRKIETRNVRPPIPTRAYDWQAWLEGSIDVCGDPDCDCRSKCKIGVGATEQAAIEDLMEQLDI
jgi:hypothetical protein